MHFTILFQLRFVFAPLKLDTHFVDCVQLNIIQFSCTIQMHIHYFVFVAKAGFVNLIANFPITYQVPNGTHGTWFVIVEKESIICVPCFGLLEEVSRIVT